jgi:cell division protein FtsZ
VSQAAEVIKQAVDPEANIIFGVTIDPSMNNEVRITLVATGFTSTKAVDAAQRDEEFRHLIKSLDETKLETPAFKRRPIDLRR